MLYYISLHLHILLKRFQCYLDCIVSNLYGMALMMENPVRSPMVPPIADNIFANFAPLSFVILSIVGVLKYILTNIFFMFVNVAS